jgi:hypothetical protein
MPAPTLVVQTTYAELLERCASASFNAAFSADGAFTSKTVKGRRYWYFQLSSAEGRNQQYVGPETPELLERINHHRETRDDERERRALVSTLVRSFGLTRTIPEIGKIVAALEKAGVFRLRGVLIGTVAYQSYPPMLGEKLPSPAMQTGDIDIAQFKPISVAVEDRTQPVLEILKGVDKTFRPVPHLAGGRVTSYAAKGGLRVDFLTPNLGPDSDDPQELPAFQTDAQPLRFLDYLIKDPHPAVLLHDAGIYVLVPAPERYAVHKLIVSRRRQAGTAKRDKDVVQAAALMEVLWRKRPFELKSAWEEAYERGPTWRQLLLEGMTLLPPSARDGTLKAINRRRQGLPELDLVFTRAPPRHDFNRDVVIFTAKDRGGPMDFEISREALDDHFEADGLSKEKRLAQFTKRRAEVEGLARVKYLKWPVEEPGVVLLKTEDIGKLRRRVKSDG